MDTMMLSPTYSNVFTNNKGTTNNNSIIMEDKKHKHTTQTRTAWYLTIATLALVALTTISVHTLKYTTMYNNDEQLRFLDENNNNDYSDQTCDDIFTMTEPSSDQRCLFAQTCNSNQGLQFSFIFCNKFNLSTTTWIIILSPFLLIWLVLLFRMLGSTAEDFFSPSLEMFSVKMGLPPRFAGVTLLALGNGAADVSATINAISQNPAEGYLMSLGALTGAGMFVGTVVAGIVIVIADGVKCRGALVRDVLMFIITLGVVYAFFHNGKIGSSAIHTFLWMYAAFVIVVLVADIYHRAVVLPRMRKLNEDTMVLSNSDENQLSAIDNNDDTDESSNTNNERQDQSTRKVSFAPSEEAGDVELASPNNLLVAPDDLDENDKGLGRSILERSHTESFSDHPDVSENSMKTKGSKPKKTNNISKVQKGVDKIMVALSNYGPNEGNPNNRNESFKGWTGGLQVTSESSDKPIKFHGQHGILNSRSSDDYLEDEESVSDNRPFSGPAASYRILLENVDNICTVDGSLSSGLNISWGNSLSTGLNEFSQHFVDYFNDIFANSDNNVFDKFFLCWELPFTVLRKITVPIPCDDYYCRGLVAISFALSPLWLGVYSLIEKDTNLFFTGGFPWIECLSIFTVLIAIFIMKFAPEEEVDMSLTVSVPIAFVGFIMAATWIDAIADKLVNLLNLLGVICRIPGSIMGITILAWGNSMGDLSANMTMAKKGLANMAITACFAGPVFNILIGLGGGFTKLNTSTGVEYTEVALSPSITVGFIFLLCNCALVLVGGLLWNRGHIPQGYGYIALALYGAYVVLSIWLQFSGGNNYSE